MEYNIIICEDEKVFSEGLKEEVAKLFVERGAACRIKICNSGSEFEIFLLRDEQDKKYVPNLIFMDIGLGDADGVELIEKYRLGEGKKVPVVFVSSMEDRVLDGYEVNALSFLYKRNYREKLPKVIARFFKEYSETANLPVKGDGKVSVLSLRNIFYIESDGRKSLIHTEDSELIDDRAIGALILELPEEKFIEVYKCVYVNIDHIARINEDSVTLYNNHSVMLSRRKRKDVINAVMNYIGENGK